MHKLDNESREVIPSSVDFFNSKPTLVAFQNSSDVEYPPVTPLGSGAINFRINSGQTYLDLTKLQLITSFRITKKGKDESLTKDEILPITSTDPVTFINAFGATFIKNLKVSFNGHQVYNSNDLYAYNAYLRRRLGLGVERDEASLQLAGYMEDGLSQMSGPGFEERRSLFENGTTFETVVSLDADIFRQKKLLLNHTVVDIEITMHNNFFTLLSTDLKTEYQYHLVDCKLIANQLMLIPNMDLAIQEKLNSNALAKYSFDRNIMKNFFISAGRYEYNAVLFSDYIPSRIFAGLVDAKAFNGHIAMSPFEFAPHNLESIRVTTNGTHTPSNAYKLNWHKKQFGRAFKDLSNTVDGSHGISVQKYLAHSCIYGFDLQISHSDKFVELQCVGSTMISLQFNAPVTENGLQLIVFAEFDSVMAMDKTRTATSAIAI